MVWARKAIRCIGRTPLTLHLRKLSSRSKPVCGVGSQRRHIGFDELKAGRRDLRKAGAAAQLAKAAAFPRRLRLWREGRAATLEGGLHGGDDARLAELAVE